MEVEPVLSTMAAVARAIHKAIRRRRPAARYVAPWYGRILLGVLAVTPTRVQDAAFRRLSFLSPSQLRAPEQLTASPTA